MFLFSGNQNRIPEIGKIRDADIEYSFKKTNLSLLKRPIGCIQKYGIPFALYSNRIHVSKEIARRGKQWRTK